MSTREELGKIGLALGGGAARGWAHVGAIQALEELGLRPDVICGTSIGSLVGAAYATNRVEALARWGKTLSWRDVLRFVDPTLSGGIVRSKRIREFMNEHLEDQPIEKMPVQFLAVATDLSSGQEVWLEEGSLMDAIRASISLPGLIAPVWDGQRWLSDGIMVNPVPASACRALGADFIIAVDLNSTQLNRWIDQPTAERARREVEPPAEPSPQNLWGLLEKREKYPSLHETIVASLTIMQNRITRSRLAGDPPDLLITPRLSKIGTLEFHRAEETIAEGYQAARRALSALDFRAG